MKKKFIALIYLGIILSLLACSDKKKTATVDKKKAAPVEDIFSYIPSQSPYVVGNLQPIPEAYLAKTLTMGQKTLSTYQKLFEKMLKPQIQATEGNPGQKLISLVEAVMDEVKSIKTPNDMLTHWGISSKASSIFYGLGFMPAMRIQVADKVKAEQLLQRLEDKVGSKMSTADFNGQSYRFLDINSKVHLKAILAVVNNYLVAGIVPAEQSMFNTFTALLLGQKKPASPLGQSAFRQKLSQYNFPGYGDGYINLQQIGAILRGEEKGLGASSLVALDADPDMQKEMGCMAQLSRSIFQNIPRVVFGMKALSEQAIDIEMTIEATPSLVETLKSIPSPIPNIAAGTEPMFAVGIGANIPQLRSAIQSLLQFVIDNSNDCPDIDADELRAMIPKLNMVLNPMVSGFHSIALAFDNIEIGADGKPRTDVIEARLAADMDDPQGLLAMGGAFLPSLANIDIDSSGKAVMVPLAGMPIQLPDLFVAINGNRLALALGSNADKKVEKASAKGEISNMPIFWLQYKSSAWSQLLQSSLSRNTSAGDEETKIILETLQQYEDMFDTVTQSVQFTPNGISFRELIVLK